MTGTPRIRPATGRDISRIAWIEMKSFSNPWSAELLYHHVKRQRDGRISFPVCTTGNSVTGYAIGEYYHPEVHITNLAVEPAKRRSGVGTLLVESLMSWACECMAREIWLEVRESNIPAREMYGRLGFQVSGRRMGYYHKPVEDALIMFYDLEPRGH